MDLLLSFPFNVVMRKKKNIIKGVWNKGRKAKDKGEKGIDTATLHQWEVKQAAKSFSIGSHSKTYSFYNSKAYS